MARPLWLSAVFCLATGCSLFGPKTQNPRYFAGGAWQASGEYYIAPVQLCEYRAAGNEKMNNAIGDYVAPALWRALKLNADDAKTQVVNVDPLICEELSRAARDNFEVAPRVKKKLASLVTRSGQPDGLVIPIAALGAFQNERELRASDGTVVATTTAPGMTASGYVDFRLAYVNREGDILFYREREGGFSCAAVDCYAELRTQAPDIVRDLVEGTPPVSIR